jgi:outer membrane beta-barrel protein
MLLVWGAQAGVEVTPLYGKLAWYEDSLAHFSIVLNGGAGIGMTKLQLKPENSAGPATFGDTGLKFLGSVGLGFRLQFGDRWAARIEVRDLVYTARVDRVNGCNFDDLTKMAAADTSNRDPAAVVASAPCRKETFAQNRTDITLAKDLVKPPPTSDVLNNVGVYAGFAFLF